MGGSRIVPVLLALLMVSPAATIAGPVSAQTDEEKPPDPYFTVEPGVGTTGTVFTADTRGSYIPPNTTVTLDWGDGTETVNRTGQLTHQYARPGTYRIELTLEKEGARPSSFALVRVHAFEPPERANETSERIEEDDFTPNDAVELLQSAPMDRTGVGTVVALVPGIEPDAFPLEDELGNVSLEYVQCRVDGCTNESLSQAEDPTGEATAAFSVMLQKALNAHYYAVDVVPESGKVDLDAITQAFGFARSVRADVAVSLLSPDAGYYDLPYKELYEAYGQAAYPQAPQPTTRTELVPFLQGTVENRAEYDYGNGFRYNVPNGYNASRPIWFTGPADSAALRASHWDRMADGNDLGTLGPLAGAGEMITNGCAPMPQSIQYSDDKFPRNQDAPSLSEYQVYENSTKLHQRLVPGDLAHLAPTQAQILPRVAERLNERVCLELTLNWLARYGTAIVVPAGDNADHRNVDDPKDADWDTQSIRGLAGFPHTITVGATTSYEPGTDGDDYGTERVVSPYSAAGPSRSLEGVKPDVLAPGDLPAVMAGNLSYEPAVRYDMTDTFRDNRTFGEVVRNRTVSISGEKLHVDGADAPTGARWTGKRNLPPKPTVHAEVNITPTPGDNRSATKYVFAVQKGTTNPPVSGFGMTFRAIGNGSVHAEAHVWNATGGEYCADTDLTCTAETDAPPTNRTLHVTIRDTGVVTLAGHRTVDFVITDGAGTTYASLTRQVPVEGDDQICVCKELTFLGNDTDTGPTTGAVFDNVTVTGLGRDAYAIYEPGVSVNITGVDLGVRPSTRIAAAYVSGVLLVENQLLLTGEAGPDRLQRLRGRLGQLAEPVPNVPPQVQGSGELNIENELKDSGLLPIREIEMTPDVGGVDLGHRPFENASRYRIHHANGSIATNRITTSHTNVTFEELSDLENSSLEADTDGLDWYRVLDTGRIELAGSDTPQISFTAERHDDDTWNATFRLEGLPETPGVYATLVPIERSGTLLDDLFSENFTMPLMVTRTQPTNLDVSGTGLPEGASAWLLPPTQRDGEHLIYEPYPTAPAGYARVSGGQLAFGPLPSAAYSLSVATNASLPVPSEEGPDGIHDGGSPRDLAVVSSHLHPTTTDPESLADLDPNASLPVPVAYRFLDIQQPDRFTVGPIEEPATPEQGLANKRTRDVAVWNERGDPARGPGHALADPFPHGRTIKGWDIDLRSRAPPAGLGTSSSPDTQALYHERLDRGTSAYNHTTLTGYLDPRPYLAEENQPYDPVHLGTTFPVPQPASDVHGVLFLPLDLEQAGAFVEISTDRRSVVRALDEDSVWTPKSPDGLSWPFDKDPRDQIHDPSHKGLLSGDGHQHPLGRTSFGPEERPFGGYLIPYSLHELPDGADTIDVNVTIHPEPQSQVGRALGALPLDPLSGPRFSLDGAALYAWTTGRASRSGDTITGLSVTDPDRIEDPTDPTPDPLEDPLVRVEPYHALGRGQGELLELYIQGHDADLCAEATTTVCSSGQPDAFDRSNRAIEAENLRYPFGHAMGPVFYEDLDTAYEHEPYADEVPRVHPTYPTEIRFRPTGPNVWRVDEDAIQAAGGLDTLTLAAGSFDGAPFDTLDEPFPDAPDGAPLPGTVPNHCLIDTGYGTATALTPYGKRFCFEDGGIYNPLRNASIPFGVDRRLAIEEDRVQDVQTFFEAFDDSFDLEQAETSGCTPGASDGFDCLGSLLTAPTKVSDDLTALPENPVEPEWPSAEPGNITQLDRVVWHREDAEDTAVANGTHLWRGTASPRNSVLVLQSVFDTDDPNATGSLMISFPNTTAKPRVLPTIEGQVNMTPKANDPAKIGRIHAFNIGEYAPNEVSIYAIPDVDAGVWKIPRLRIVPLKTVLTFQGSDQPWGNWQGQLAPTCRVTDEDGSCMGPPVGVKTNQAGTQEARFLTVPSLPGLIEDLTPSGTKSFSSPSQLWSGAVPHTDAFLLVRHNFTDANVTGNEHVQLRLGLRGEGPTPSHALATLEGVDKFRPSDPTARSTRLDVFDLSGYQGRHATLEADVHGNTTWNVHEARVVRAPLYPGPAPRDDPGLTESDHPTVPASTIDQPPQGPQVSQIRIGPGQLDKTDPTKAQVVHAPAGFTVDESTGDVTLRDIHLVLGGDVGQGARIHVTDGQNLTIENATIVPRHPAYRWGIHVDEGANLELTDVTLMRGGHPRQSGVAVDVAGNATLDRVRLLGGTTAIHVSETGRLNATDTTIARFSVAARVEGTARLTEAFVDGNLLGLTAREGVLAVRDSLFTSNRDGAIVTQDSVTAVQNATFAWNGAGGQAAALRTIEGLDTGHTVVHDARFVENTDAIRTRARSELHDVSVVQGNGTALHATPAAPVKIARFAASTSDAAVIVDAGGLLHANASRLQGATPIACTSAGEPDTIHLSSTQRDRIGPVHEPGLLECEPAWIQTDPGQGAGPGTDDPDWRGIAARRHVHTTSPALVVPMDEPTGIEQLNASNTSHTLSLDQRDPSQGELASTLEVSGAAPDVVGDWITYRAAPQGSTGHRFALEHNLTVDRVAPDADIDIAAPHIRGWTRATSMPVIVNATEAGSGRATMDLIASTIRPNLRQGFDEVTVLEGLRGGRAVLGHGSRANLPTVSGEETQLHARVTDRAGNADTSVVESVKVDSTPPRAWIHAANPCGNLFGYDLRWHGHDPMRGSQLRYPANWPANNNWSYNVSWAPLNIAWLGLAMGLNLTDLLNLTDVEALGLLEDLAAALGVQGTVTVPKSKLPNAFQDQLGVEVPALALAGLLPDLNIKLPLLTRPLNPQVLNAMTLRMLDQAQGISDLANDTTENATGLLLEKWRPVGTYTRNQERAHLSQFVNLTSVIHNVTRFVEEHENLSREEANRTLANVSTAVQALHRIKANQTDPLEDIKLPSLLPNGSAPEARALLHKALGRPLEMTQEEVDRLHELVNQTLEDLLTLRPLVAAVRVEARDAVGNMEAWQDPVIADVFRPTPLLYLLGDNIRERVVPMVMQAGANIDLESLHTELSLMDADCGLADVTLELDLPLSLEDLETQTLYPRDGRVNLDILDMLEIYPESICGLRTPKLVARDVFGRTTTLDVDTIIDRVAPDIVDDIDIYDPIKVVGVLPNGEKIKGIVPFDATSTDEFLRLGTYNLTLDVDTGIGEDCDVAAPIHEVSVDAQIGDLAEVTVFSSLYGPNVSGNHTNNENTSVVAEGSMNLTLDPFGLEPEDLLNTTIDVDACAMDEAGQTGCVEVLDPNGTDPDIDPIPPVCGGENLGLHNVPNPPVYQPVPKLPNLIGLGGREIPVNWSAFDADSGPREPILLVRPHALEDNISLPLLDNVTLPSAIEEELNQTLLFLENQTQPWYTKRLLLYELEQMLPIGLNGSLPLGGNLSDQIPLEQNGSIPYSYWSVLNETTSRFDLWRDNWGDKWPEDDWFDTTYTDGNLTHMAGEGEIAHHNLTPYGGTDALPEWLTGPFWHPVEMTCLISDDAGNVNLTEPVNVTLDTELPIAEWLPELDPTDPSLNDTEPLTDQLFADGPDDLVPDPNNTTDPNHWFNTTPTIPLGVVEQVSGIQDATVEAGIEGSGVTATEDLSGQVGQNENDSPHARINSTTTFTLEPASLTDQDGVKWWLNLTVRDNVNNTWNDSMEVAFDLTDPVAELCELTGNLVDGFLPVDLYVFDACIDNAPSTGTYRSPLIEDSLEMVLESTNGDETVYNFTTTDTTIELDMDTSGPKEANLSSCDAAGNCDHANLSFKADLENPVGLVESFPTDHARSLVDGNDCLDERAQQFAGATVHWLEGAQDVVFNLTDIEADVETSVALEDRVSGVQQLQVWAERLDPETLEPTGDRTHITDVDLGTDVWRPFEHVEVNVSKLAEHVPYRFVTNATDRVGNYNETLTELTDHIIAWDVTDPEATLEQLPEFNPDLSPNLLGNVTDELDPTTATFDACIDRLGARINASGTVSVQPFNVSNVSVGFDAATGNYSFDANASLEASTEGTEVEICARGRDRANNTGACSTTRATIPDLTPPDSFLDDLLDDLLGDGFLPVNNSTDPKEYGFDPLENNTGPGTQSPIAHVNLSLEDPTGARANFTLDASQVEADASMTFDFGLSGTYHAQIEACDEVGHCHDPRTGSFFIDLNAPLTTLNNVTTDVLNTSTQNDVEILWIDSSIDATFNTTDNDTDLEDGSGPAGLTAYAQPMDEVNLTEDGAELSTDGSLIEEGDLWALFDASFSNLDPNTLYRFETNATDVVGNVEANPVDEPRPLDVFFAYDAQDPETILDELDEFTNETELLLAGNASDLNPGAESGIARLTIQATRTDGSTDRKHTGLPSTPEALDYELTYTLAASDEGQPVDLCVLAEDVATNVGACSTTQTTTLDITPPNSSFDELAGQLVDGFLNVSEHDDGTYSFSPTVANVGEENKSAIEDVTLTVTGPGGFENVSSLNESELDAGAEITFEYGDSGDHTAVLSACDAAGNCEQGPERAFLNFTVDLVPPNSTLEAFTDGLLNQTPVNGTDVAFVDGHATATLNVSDDDGSGAASLEVTAQPVDEAYQPNATPAAPAVEQEATLVDDTGPNVTFEVSFSNLAEDQAYRFETNATDQVGNTEANETHQPDPIPEPAWAYDATLPDAALDQIPDYRRTAPVDLTGSASDRQDGFEAGLANLTIQVDRIATQAGDVTDTRTLGTLLTGEEDTFSVTDTVDPDLDDGFKLAYCAKGTDRATQTGGCSATRSTIVDNTTPNVTVDPLQDVVQDLFVNDLPLEVNLTVENTVPHPDGHASPLDTASLWSVSNDPASTPQRAFDLAQEELDVAAGEQGNLTVDVDAREGYTYAMRGYAGDVVANRDRRGSADPTQPLNVTNEAAVWAMDGDATDASGNDINGTVSGATFTQDAKHGQALALDGTDDYDHIGDSSLINEDTFTERTVTAWIKTDDNRTGHKQVVYEEGAGARGVNVYVHDGRVYVGGWNEPDDETDWDPGTWLSAPLPTGEWHHVALWIDADNATSEPKPDSLRLYLDGEKVASGTGAQVYDHGGDIDVGATGGTKFHDTGDFSTSGHDAHFDGSIDEVRVWEDALTPRKIRTLAAGPYEPYPEDQRPAPTTVLVDTLAPVSTPAPADRFLDGDVVNVTTDDPTPGPQESGVANVTLDAMVLDAADYRTGQVLEPTELAIRQADGAAIQAGDTAEVERRVFNHSYPVDVEVEVTVADTVTTSPDTSACADPGDPTGALFWAVYLDGTQLAREDLTSDGTDAETVTLGPVQLAEPAPLTLALEADSTWQDCYPTAEVSFDDVIARESDTGTPLLMDPMTSLDDWTTTASDSLTVGPSTPEVDWDGASQADSTADLRASNASLTRVDLPIAFPSYDRFPHGTIWVSETGAIALEPGFDEASTQTNFETQRVIAPAWNDSFTASADGREVTIDTRREDQVTIVWDVGTDAQPTSQRRFAATLMRTGEVLLGYEPGNEPAPTEVDIIGVSDGTGDTGRQTQLAPTTENLTGETGLVPGGEWAPQGEATESLGGFQVTLPTDLPLRLRTSATDEAANTETVDDVAETESYVDTEPPIVDVQPYFDAGDGTGFSDASLRVKTTAADLGRGVHAAELVVTNLSDTGEPTTRIPVEPGNNVTNVTDFQVTHLDDYGLELIAHDAPALDLEDTFDDGEEGGDGWASIQNGFENDNCRSSSSPYALWFGNDGTRAATTEGLDATAGATIQFDLKIGTSTSESNDPKCENADSGEEVELQYKTADATSWTTIATYSTTAFPDFDTVTEELPTEAETDGVQVRWIQPSHSGSSYDHWAIDDVHIETTGGNVASTEQVNFTAKILPVPEIELERALDQASTFVDDTFTGAAAEGAGIVSGERLSVPGSAVAESASDTQPVDVTIELDGTQVFSGSGSQVNFSEILDLAKADPGRHTLEINTSTPEGSWNVSRYPFNVTDPVLANSSLESNVQKDWTLTGDTVAVDASARRLGDKGLNLTAQANDGETESATFELDRPMDSAHYWAFVNVSQTPTGDGFRVLDLQNSAGETVFSYKIDENRTLWALDDGVWVDTGKTLREGSWYKVEARVDASDVEAFVDSHYLASMARSSLGKIQQSSFQAVNDLTAGSLHTDDLANTVAEEIHRVAMEDDFETGKWRDTDTDTIREPESSPIGDKALHLDSTISSPDVVYKQWSEQFKPGYWVTLSAGSLEAHGDYRGCPGPGTIIRLMDGDQDTLAKLQCDGTGVEVLDADGLHEVNVTALSKSAYNRFMIGATGDGFIVKVNGQFGGHFSLNGSNPVREMRLGGGDAELWFDDFAFFRGRLELEDGIDAILSDAWTVDDSASSVTINRTTSNVFTGSHAFQVSVEANTGEGGSLNRSIHIEGDDDVRIEEKVYIPGSSLQVQYDGYRLLMLYSDQGEEAGVSVDENDDLFHELYVKGSDDSEPQPSGQGISTGWHTLALEAKLSKADPEALIYLDGTSFARVELANRTLTKVVIGDTITDALATKSGAGNATIDQLRILGQNARPLPEVDSPTPGSTVPNGTVTLRGQVDIRDFGDNLDELKIKIDGGAWIEIPKGPDWSYEWDTTSLDSSETHHVTVRAIQGDLTVDENVEYTVAD